MSVCVTGARGSLGLAQHQRQAVRADPSCGLESGLLVGLCFGFPAGITEVFRVLSICIKLNQSDRPGIHARITVPK